MSIDDPYAPPLAELSSSDDASGNYELARRLTRLAASFLDGIINWVIAVPLWYFMGTWDYVKQGQAPPLPHMILLSFLGFVGFLLIHGYFLKANGQTIGKKLTQIRIANLDGSVPSFATVILIRYLPITLVSLIPIIGPYLPLIDVVFIFRKDRRCIHDLIAGTQVIIAK
jgi:uncharacterized RDD family membrane protein YckC